MAQGYFITLEGGEGAGKSTQARILKELLEEKGIHIVLTREPGGSTGAELIRKLLVNEHGERWDPVSEYLLFSAARREHLIHTVWPALQKGYWVICDRYYDSSRAYQGAGHGLDSSFMDIIYKTISPGFCPHLTILLDMEVQVGLERALKRAGNENRFEKMGLSYHEKVRQAFLDMAKEEPHRFRVVNASQSLEKISYEIRDIIIKRFFTTENFVDEASA